MEEETEFELEEEEGVNGEELLAYILEKLEALEASLLELKIDHEALFYVMRSSGKFSKEAFITVRRDVRRQLEAELGEE